MKFIMSTEPFEENYLYYIIVERLDISPHNPLTITIPAEIDGKKVLVVGKNHKVSSIIKGRDVPSEMWKTLHIELVLSEGIEEINNSAFIADANIVSVTLPSSLKTIGNMAFKSCRFLKEVIVPENSKLTRVSHKAFLLSSVRAFNFPATIKQIGNNAFSECELKDVTFAEDIKDLTIFTEAFKNCKLQTLTLPKSIKKLGRAAFAYIDSLKTVVFPNDCLLTAIPDDCFNFCEELESVTLGKNIKKLGATAFFYCDLLKEIDLSGLKLKEIGQECFANSGLEEISIPATVTNIGKFCFNRSHLKNAVIPECEEYGDFLFTACHSLESVKFIEVKRVKTMAFSCCMFSETHSLINFEFPNKLEKLGRGAFTSSGISHVDMVKTNVHTINEFAFAHTRIKTMALPEHVNYVSSKAFFKSEYPKDVVEEAAVFYI